MNSEFSFSKPWCFIKIKEPSFPYSWPMAGWKIDEFMLFQKGIDTKRNKLFCPGFEFGSPVRFLMLSMPLIKVPGKEKWIELKS